MRARPRRRRRPQRGFTLIELMVALVVSSLLVGMIFSIFIRMSVAYRGQQQVAEVQSKLAAARAKIEIDAKLAGLYMADGLKVPGGGGGGESHSPLRVINGVNGQPDEIAFYYADTSAQATVVPGGAVCNQTQCNRVDSTSAFQVNDVIVMSTVGYADSPFGGAQLARFDACVLQISGIGPNSLSFAQTGDWGGPMNLHCGNPAVGTMFYKLAARHWRIDPARPDEGVLQRQTLGSLRGPTDWQDQAYGFTDLQVATRFFEAAGQEALDDTPDPDDDPQRDWYSGADQDNLTRPESNLVERPPIQVSISLVARTERDVEGIASSSTPQLTVPDNESHNTIGDRAAIPLPSELPALSGNRIFRYTTFQVDLRNLGVGR